MVVKLYSTGCPKCHVLEAKLKQAGIAYRVIEGEHEIRGLGYNEAPLLQADGMVMSFMDAVAWINKRGR